MRPFLMKVARAVTYQILGAALLAPGAVALGVLILHEFTPLRLLVLWVCCLPASLAVAAIPFIQRVELTATEELLRVAVPDRPDRVRLSVFGACHLFVGATLSALAVVTITGVAHSFAVSWRNQPWKPLLGIVMLSAILGAMLVCAAVQRRIAAGLKASLHSEIDRLERRERLAAELHDSVGHTLSVVLVQAMAVKAVVEAADPPTAWSPAIGQLIDTARDAQQQLDDLLGVLDEDAAGRGPTLAEVDRLIAGLDVDYRHDAVDGIAPEISRVAFALAREALTNAIRHGEAPVSLRITVSREVVVSTVNRIRSGGAARSGGRGLTGMRMRAALVGGACTWWEEDDQWHTRAALPLKAR